MTTRSRSNRLAGTILAGCLMGLTSGCGGGANEGLAKPPEATGKLDLSAMPGMDASTGKMKTNKTE